MVFLVTSKDKYDVEMALDWLNGGPRCFERQKRIPNCVRMTIWCCFFFRRTNTMSKWLSIDWMVPWVASRDQKGSLIAFEWRYGVLGLFDGPIRCRNGLRLTKWYPDYVGITIRCPTHFKGTKSIWKWRSNNNTMSLVSSWHKKY